MIVLIIFGIFMVIIFSLNDMFRLSVLSSSDSPNAHLPTCFRPRTFRLNIGLHIFFSDSFVYYLDFLLGYSTWAFQALQLIVLVVFGAVD